MHGEAQRIVTSTGTDQDWTGPPSRVGEGHHPYNLWLWLCSPGPPKDRGGRWAKDLRGVAGGRWGQMPDARHCELNRHSTWPQRNTWEHEGGFVRCLSSRSVEGEAPDCEACALTCPWVFAFHIGVWVWLKRWWRLREAGGHSVSMTIRLLLRSLSSEQGDPGRCHP